MKRQQVPDDRKWSLSDLVPLLPVLLFGAGAALFAWAGSFSRFWADDYCYSAYLQLYGLLRGIAAWHQESGNRVTTLVLVAASDQFGLDGLRAVPAALLVLWAAGGFCFLRGLAQRMGWRVPALWWLALALGNTYFAALLAPDRLQTIYWRMGTLHYSMPVPLLLLHLGGLAAWGDRRGSRGVLLALGSGTLAFFTAGLSETFAALQAGIFGVCLLLALARFRSSASGPRLAWLAFLPGLVGTLLMMLIMLRSPSNAWRQAALPPPDNILLVIPYAFRYTLDFLFFSLRGQIVPFAVFSLFAAALAAASGWTRQIRLSTRGLVAWFGGIIAVTVLWIACSFAPSAYAGLAYPAGRALMPGFAVLLAGLAAAGVLLAALALRFLPGQWWFYAALALVLALSLYPLRGWALPQADAQRLAGWAERWDARDAQIAQARAAGILDVPVQEIEVVQSLEDLRPDAAHWVNVCAAIHYQVRSITANP